MKSEITSKEAAELLELTEGRIRQIVTANLVRSRKIGNTRLIKRIDIEKLMETRQHRRKAA